MKSIKDKNLLIYGTGAVGGYYGGMLAKAGFDVTFVARGKNYEALKQNGLTLIRDGKKEIIPIKVFSNTKDLGAFDYIFICVKSFHTKDILEKIKENIDSRTTLISLQNGIENEEIMVERYGREKVIGAFVYIASQLINPGIVEVIGNTKGMIGELDGSITERIKELQSMFKSINVDFVISKNIMGDMWDKLVWNTAFNSTSVLTGKTLDQILGDKTLFSLVRDIMTEVKHVAIANKIKIRPDTVEFNLERSKGYTGFKTSMLQDFEAGRPLELEELVGVVIRKAKEKNISVPNIEKVYKEVKQKTVKTKV